MNVSYPLHVCDNGKEKYMQPQTDAWLLIAPLNIYWNSSLPFNVMNSKLYVQFQCRKNIFGKSVHAILDYVRLRSEQEKQDIVAQLVDTVTDFLHW